MQLHVGSTVLIESVVLAVTTVVQVLEGCNNVTVHGADLVASKEEGCVGYARHGDHSVW